MVLVTFHKKTASKTEQAKLILQLYCILKGLKLSKSEEEVMAYFMVYKISKETKKLIVSSGILKSVEAVANALTELKKKALLVRDKDADRDKNNNSYQIVKDLNIVVESKMGMVIKLYNT